MTNPDDECRRNDEARMFTSAFLNVEVPDVQRVVFDELAARLDDVAHQAGEHLIGFDGIIVVQIDLQQACASPDSSWSRTVPWRSFRPDL